MDDTHTHVLENNFYKISYGLVYKFQMIYLESHRTVILRGL